MRNIVLTGFMGTGKTSTGLILAKKLQMNFVDTDDLVETAAGFSVRDIFAERGEKYFRKLEKEAVKHVAGLSGLVVATGGGVVKDRANMQRLRKTGTVVALLSDEKTILRRVLTEGSKRPLLNVPAGKRLKRVKALLAERLPLITGSADYILDASCLTPASTAEKILCLLKKTQGR